ncbi:MAG: PilZ domain-containing protein [Gammaproteobacteria bacterium]|nr:PilZ domain-containing protein [Gammaproteobacteria bacterium]
MKALASESNAFIQHPDAVAARLCITSDHDSLGMDLIAHGQGGVCVPSQLGYQPGTPLQVRVCVSDRELRYHGLVLWRRARRQAFELGLGFATDDAAFRARMVEQLCHIEAYRQRAVAAGRMLDFEGAAREWIARYSSGFPQIGGCCPSIPWRQAQPTVAVG